MENDIRWLQRFDNFSKAFSMLREFIGKGELNKFEEQGLIQCFEYTFELAWKTMKDYLEEAGYTPKSPRETIQIAFQSGLVLNGHVWIDALENRNIMAHTYSEKNAQKAVHLIRSNYYQMIFDLFDVLTKAGQSS